jgi:hypothetical protein
MTSGRMPDVFQIDLDRLDKGGNPYTPAQSSKIKIRLLRLLRHPWKKRRNGIPPDQKQPQYFIPEPDTPLPSIMIEIR